MPETNFKAILQQWHNHNSSMKNTYNILFGRWVIIIIIIQDLPIHQQQIWLDNWIHHIKTVGNHSLSVTHMLPQTRNLLPTSFTAVTKSWSKYVKHLLVTVWNSSTIQKAKMTW